MQDPKPFYTEVGRRIRKLRDERGLSQEALASFVGLTRTSITNIERGNQKVLLHTFLDIASVLGTAAAALLPEGEGRPVVEPDQLEERMPETLSEREKEWVRSVVVDHTDGRRQK